MTMENIFDSHICDKINKCVEDIETRELNEYITKEKKRYHRQRLLYQIINIGLKDNEPFGGNVFTDTYRSARNKIYRLKIYQYYKICRGNPPYFPENICYAPPDMKYFNFVYSITDVFTSCASKYVIKGCSPKAIFKYINNYLDY